MSDDDELDRQLRAGAPRGRAEEPHPDDGALRAWVQGNDDTLDAHLSECSACRALARELRRAGAMPPLDVRRPPPKRWWVGGAVAIAASALALLLVRGPESTARFDLEEASVPVAAVRGGDAADHGNYPLDGVLVLRLRGDVPLAAISGEFEPQVLVVGDGGVVERVVGVTRRDEGATVELRIPVRSLMGDATGARAYWVAIAPAGVRLEGSTPSEVDRVALQTWPRVIHTLTEKGAP